MTASLPQTWLSAAINHIMEPEIAIILNGLSYKCMIIHHSHLLLDLDWNHLKAVHLYLERQFLSTKLS